MNLKKERKLEKRQPLVYPYETEEFKIYETKNGRKFEVYRNGRVFALPFLTNETGIMNRHRSFNKYREVIPSPTKDNYYEMNIGGRTGEKWLLHRLIAFCWLENSNNYSTVDHKNCNKGDNSAENLEWVTREENRRREYINNLNVKHDISSNYINWKISMKLNPIQKNEIKKMFNNGKTYSQIQEIFNISKSQIYAILHNLNHTSENNELFEKVWYFEYILTELNSLRNSYLIKKNIVYYNQILKKLPDNYKYYD